MLQNRTKWDAVKEFSCVSERTPGADSKAPGSLNATSAELTTVDRGDKATAPIKEATSIETASTTSAANANPASAKQERRTINIGTLGEDELLNMVRGYINSMLTFAQNTRNVRKKLMETLTNTSMVSWYNTSKSRVKSLPRTLGARCLRPRTPKHLPSTILMNETQARPEVL